MMNRIRSLGPGLVTGAPNYGGLGPGVAPDTAAGGGFSVYGSATAAGGAAGGVDVQATGVLLVALVAVLVWTGLKLK